MATAGYVSYDPATRHFTLPPEHAPALAQEGDILLWRVHQMIPSMAGILDQVTESFGRWRRSAVGL